MKVVIVGSGAAAYGAVEGLCLPRSARNVDIVVVSPDRRLPAGGLTVRDPREWPADEKDTLHRSMKEQGAKGFPPPRSHFGALIDFWDTEGDGAIGRSEYLGGLGNFWSNGLFPFRAQDMTDWAIGYQDLKPYYQHIADRVGLAAVDDGLAAVYPDSFATLPPIEVSGLAARLIARLEGGVRAGGMTVTAGINRLAVDTRPASGNSCVYCGGCMYGCFRGALFRPGARIEDRARRDELKLVSARVSRVNPDTGSGARVELVGGESIDADRVLLCAGAAATSEILLRSFDLVEQPVYIDDNEFYAFPILAPFAPEKDVRDAFAFGNATICYEPDFNHGHFAQSSVTPFPEYLLGYYMPTRMVGRLRALLRAVQARVLLSALHIDGSTAARYAMRLDRKGTTRLTLIRRGASDFRARAVVGALKEALHGSGFHVPRFPMIRTGTSYHYVGGFAHPAGGVSVDRDGRVAGGLYVADSAAFPRASAQPLTFAIMANAMRVAHEVVV